MHLTRRSGLGKRHLFLKGRVCCIAIKSFTDTYKIKGSDIDRFCRIMSDTKKIKIQITNDHHDLKDVEEYRKLFGFVKNDCVFTDNWFVLFNF